MRPSEQLAQFAQEALAQGRSRKEIAAALSDAGWSQSEIDGALDTWSETDFPIPVPRPRPFLSAKEAFYYGLMFVALAVTSFNLVTLLFNLINNWIPDASDVYTRWDADSARWSISYLIVFGPLFFWLAIRTGRASKEDPANRRSTIRKWFGYITLFLAAITLLGDLIFAIYTFLDGDLTVRFLAKASVLMIVAGTIFQYHRAEMSEVDDV